MRKSILIAALAALTVTGLAATSQAQLGQNALSKCADSVVAACNKNKNDDAVNPCIDNGLSQCEKEHKASVKLPRPTRTQATGLATPGR